MPEKPFEHDVLASSPAEPLADKPHCRVKWVPWCGAGLMAVITIAAGALFMVMRPNPQVREQAIYIPPHSSTYKIASLLREQNLIPNTWVFMVGASLYKVLPSAKPLKAGEYLMPTQASIWSILHVIASGKVIVHKFTVPEGYRISQVMELLSRIPILTGEVQAQPEEGALLPETYTYRYGDTRQSIIDQMHKAMTLFMEQQWLSRSVDQAVIQNPQEAIVLASIVEKETGIASERPRIAGVFINRLRIGMRLQSDPTVVYALTSGIQDLERPLTLKDLTYPSPYNTYVIAALPPKPIACPGKEALLAVLHPEATDALYFVADGTGGHVFSRDFREHTKHVATWRRIKKTNARVDN